MQDFQHFHLQCVFARSLFVHLDFLAREATDEDHARAQRIAPAFFADMISGLSRLMVLEVSKLLDPARSFGQVNLSVKHIVDTSPGDKADGTLRESLEGLNSFSAKIRPARDKYIAHNDRDAIKAGAVLGVVPKEAWEQFWRDLEYVVNWSSKANTGHGETVTDIVGLTDMPCLMKALERAEAFDRLVEAGNVGALMELAGFQ